MPRILQGMEDAVTRPDDRALVELIRDTYPWSKVVPVRMGQRASFERIRAGQDDFVRGHVEVRHSIRDFDDRRRVLVPDADVHRQAIRYLPVILKEAAVVADPNARRARWFQSTRESGNPSRKSANGLPVPVRESGFWLNTPL